MALYCRMIRVKAEYRDEYIRLHQNPRKEVRQVMKENGMVRHAIFSKNEILVSVFEYEGNDFEADMKKIGNHSATRAWWEIISPMQDPFEDRKDGEWWSMLEPLAGFGWELSNQGDKDE